MRKILIAFFVVMAVVVFAPGEVHAQSPAPNLEDIVSVGAFVPYNITTTGAGVRSTVPIYAPCPMGGKLIGVVMSENIHTPAWTGSSYWDLAIGTPYNAVAVVHTATETGNKTLTLAYRLHARTTHVVNWSVLANTALTPALIAEAIAYTAGTSYSTTVWPFANVDYSAPDPPDMSGITSVSAVYNVNSGGLEMTASGEIAPVCINDPQYYYMGETLNLSNDNPGGADYHIVDVPVNVDMNGPNRLLAVLTDSSDTVVESREHTHAWKVYVKFNAFAYNYFLYEDGWYEPGARLDPSVNKICFTSKDATRRMRVWNNGGDVWVLPCKFPESLEYPAHVSYSNVFALDEYANNNYTMSYLRTEATGVSGSVSVTMRPILMGQGPVEESTACSDRFKLGSEIRTDSVPAYDASPYLAGGQYGEAIAGLEAGKYYAIDIVDPPWQQGDSHPPANSYLSQYTTLWDPGPVGSSVWYDPAQVPNSCVEDLDGLGRTRIYFYVDQTAYAPLYGIRAADPAGDWTNNLGDLSYRVYNAVYTPLESSCAANYDVGNLIVSNVQIRADYEDGGFVVPGTHQWQPNQSYMVEISGEPWMDDGTIPSHAIEVSYDGGATWIDIDDLTGEFCISEAGYGQRRWYLTHLTGRTYKLRAKDPNGTYLSNSGFISYSVYTATYFGEDGACTNTFTLGSQVATGSVNAALEDGGPLSMPLTPGLWYMIETVSPPWTENGTPSGDADFSGNNYPGHGWDNLLDYPGAACAETTDLYQRIYFRPQYDKYWIRAGGTDNTWTNHAANLNYRIYQATITDPNDPPPASCEDNYNQQRVLLSVLTIFSNDPNGQMLSTLDPGLYAIESLDGPWMDGETISYDLAYREEEQFYPMTPSSYSGPVECVVLLSDEKHIRAYVNVTPIPNVLALFGGNGVSVYDPDGLFSDNTGKMNFTLYKVTAAGEPPPFPEPPPESTCNGVCDRPDGILEVANWLEYGRCAFSKFIAFCPYHAEGLTAVLDAFNEREPFKTFNEIASLPGIIKAQFDTYDWDNPSGGAESLQAPTGAAAQWYDILPNLPSDSPWNNGKIVLTKPMSTIYSQACTLELTSVIGTKLGAPVCFMLNVMNGIGAIKWMQFVLDTVMLVLFGLYISQAWLKQGG